MSSYTYEYINFFNITLFSLLTFLLIFISIQEISKCPYTENKLFLTLVLRSNTLDDIIPKKRYRANKKLSKFFDIPQVNVIHVDTYIIKFVIVSTKMSFFNLFSPFVIIVLITG